ncbi:class A beta-lactamase [Pararhodospirillum oryzae]|nr:class A beta-lactamase [Pararhodospirillum oryzae]
MLWGMGIVLAVLAVTPARAGEDPVAATARAVEARLDARVGVFVVDTGGGTTWAYRADERFPMASTFKALACGALLARIQAGEESADTSVPIEAQDLVSYAPVTKTLVGQRVPVLDLCAITLRTSDNTAANKILEHVEGPAGLTRFVRALGDETTRLDRWETALNEGIPDDPRDTTSPRAMATTLRALVLGPILSEDGRLRLVRWLESNAVSGSLLRAGVPADWRIADRSGAGGHGTRGLTAVAWPPGRAPLVIAIYLTKTEAPMADRDAAIADIGRALVAALDD